MLLMLKIAEDRELGNNQLHAIPRVELRETLANSRISPTSGKGESDRFQRLEKLLQEAFQELERLKKADGGAG